MLWEKHTQNNLGKTSVTGSQYPTTANIGREEKSKEPKIGKISILRPSVWASGPTINKNVGKVHQEGGVSLMLVGHSLVAL